MYSGKKRHNKNYAIESLMQGIDELSGIDTLSEKINTSLPL
jgi:hypothetical protein